MSKLSSRCIKSLTIGNFLYRVDFNDFEELSFLKPKYSLSFQCYFFIFSWTFISSMMTSSLLMHVCLLISYYFNSETFFLRIASTSLVISRSPLSWSAIPSQKTKYWSEFQNYKLVRSIFKLTIFQHFKKRFVILCNEACWFFIVS